MGGSDLWSNTLPLDQWSAHNHKFQEDGGNKSCGERLGKAEKGIVTNVSIKIKNIIPKVIMSAAEVHTCPAWQLQNFHNRYTQSPSVIGLDQVSCYLLAAGRSVPCTRFPYTVIRRSHLNDVEDTTGEGNHANYL